MPRPEDQSDVLRLALPGPQLDLTVDPVDLILSPHAIARYRERVEGVSRKLAVRHLEALVAGANWRARPLSWTRIVLHPGVVYGYSTARPDVCLLVRDGVLVTVLTRKLLGRSWTRAARSAA